MPARYWGDNLDDTINDDPIRNNDTTSLTTMAQFGSTSGHLRGNMVLLQGPITPDTMEALQAFAGATVPNHQPTGQSATTDDIDIQAITAPIHAATAAMSPIRSQRAPTEGATERGPPPGLVCLTHGRGDCLRCRRGPWRLPSVAGDQAPLAAYTSVGPPNTTTPNDGRTEPQQETACYSLSPFLADKCAM